MLPIPDPRTWPTEIRTWFRDAAGECGPLDVFIFNHGKIAALYLQDAVTAAAILEVGASEWHTERGYPAYFFDPQRIGEIQHRLGVCGYTVHCLEPAGQQKQPRKRKQAPVVSIACARERKRKTE
jgi:hypothetical protein